jgi:hypothetical protein
MTYSKELEEKFLELQRALPAPYCDCDIDLVCDRPLSRPIEYDHEGKGYVKDGKELAKEVSHTAGRSGKRL